MGVGWVPNGICHTLLLIIRVSKKTSVQGQPKHPVQWGAGTPRSCEHPTIKRRINPAVVGRRKFTSTMGPPREDRGSLERAQALVLDGPEFAISRLCDLRNAISFSKLWCKSADDSIYFIRS